MILKCIIIQSTLFVFRYNYFYLKTEVKERSNNQFDTIRPTVIDGRPQYEFINSTLYQATLPLSVLYKPVVLSQERYDEIKPTLGHLVINTQCKDYNNTEGINPYGSMDEIDYKAGYKAKITINEKGFGYPIQYITIDVVKKGILGGKTYFAKDIIVNESYYTVEFGSLYFTKPLEEIISETYLDFKADLQQAWIDDPLGSEVHYNIHIYFDLFLFN